MAYYFKLQDKRDYKKMVECFKANNVQTELISNTLEVLATEKVEEELYYSGNHNTNELSIRESRMLFETIMEYVLDDFESMLKECIDNGIAYALETLQMELD